MELNKVLILALVFLLLAGCSSGSRDRGDDNYLSGTQGIELSFIGQSPPSIVYVDENINDDIPIELEARNLGTSISPRVEIFFTGYDERVVDISQPADVDFSDDFDRRTRFNPEGGYADSYAEMRVRDLGNVDNYEFPLKVVYCYDYETIAAVQLCVDPNPNRGSQDDACTPSSVSTSGQGAPIGISSIEQENMPGRVRLKINVQHYGQGEILTSDAQCRGIPARSEQNYVEFTTPVLGGIGGIPGQCSSDDNRINLRSGKGTIICTFELPDIDQGSYETILEMQLYNYKIKDSIQRNIKVINERIII